MWQESGPDSGSGEDNVSVTASLASAEEEEVGFRFIATAKEEEVDFGSITSAE